MNARLLTIAAALLAATVPAHGQRSAAVAAPAAVSGHTGAGAVAGTGSGAKTAPAPSLAGKAAAHGAASLAALDCMIQPNQVVQVGSPSPGVIEALLVDRGDLVQRGQPVVQLNATVERAALAVARERAGQTGDATVASSSRELARRELMRAEELHQQQYVSRTYLDKLRAEAGVADGRSDQARERRKLSTREADLAAAQLEQRTVRAPISGVVLERLMSPGEFVDQKPMLRLATIDPLRVDVLVPAAAFGQVSIGMVGRVTPEILNRSVHSAVVKTVDRVIDAASNTFRVRLELPNPGNTLPAGLRCKLDLSALDLPQAAAPATPLLPPSRPAAAGAAAAAPAVPPAPRR
jgi:RND family efflux transporter MFP subunit